MAFEQYPPGTAVDRHTFFATVAEMVAATVRDGEQCHTSGYTTASDGGGTADGYTYHSTGRPAVATGDGRPGFVIDGADADDWFEANNQSIANVSQFGAAGGADDTIAVQAAIDSSAPEVLIPEITLTCSNLTIPSYRRIIGLGHNSILMQKAGASSPFIHMVDTRPGLPYLFRCIESSIDELTIMGVDGDGHVAVLMSSTYQVRMSNVHIDMFRDTVNRTGVGLLFEDSNDAINTRCAFTDCLIDNCDTAIEMDSGFSNRSVGYHKFHGLNIGLEAVGIRLKNTNPNGSINNLFSGVMFQDSAALDGEFHTGTVVSATSTTIQLDPTGASAVDDSYIGATVYIKAGTGAGQIRECTDYVAIGETVTVGAVWTVTPDSTSVYVVTKRIHLDCNGQGNTFISTVHDNTSGVDILMRENAQGNQVYNPAAGSIYDNLQGSGGARNTLHSTARGQGGWGDGDPFVFSNLDGGQAGALALSSAGILGAGAGPEFRFGTTNSSIQYRISASRNDTVARLNFMGVTSGAMMYLYDLDGSVKFPRRIVYEPLNTAVTAPSVDISGRTHMKLSAVAPEAISSFTGGVAGQLYMITTEVNVQLVASTSIFLDSTHDGLAKTKWIFLANSSTEFEEYSRSS